MPTWTTPTYQLTNSQVTITADVEWIVRTLESILVDAVTIAPAAATKHQQFHVSGSSDGTFELSGLTPWAGTVPASEIMARLMTAINRLALDAVDQQLCLHGAAGVTPDGGFALLAHSGVGKTTLLTTLLTIGTTGVTDEMLVVEPTSGMIASWPKPLSIKPGTLDLLPGLRARLVNNDQTFAHIPLSSFRPPHILPLALRAMFVLERSETEDLAVTPMDEVSAAMAVIDNSLNFFSVGTRRALDSVAALASTVPCYRVTLGPPQETAAVILRTLQHSQTISVPWEVLTPSLASRAERDVDTLALDKQAVLVEASAGRVCALDEAGTSAWRRILDGDPATASDFPDFLRALRQNGFLR